MKKIISISLLLMSFTAMANLEALLGTYKAKDGDGQAVVTRTIVTERTLFEPETYHYEVEIEREKDNVYRSLILKPNASNTTLVGRTSDDCDNPDCHAFDTLDVEIKKVKGTAQLKLTYEGYITTDEDDTVEGFEGEALFIKK
jgi:hypothetical protein